MASTYNKEWNNLSIEEKRDVIRVALKNGIRELPDIKAKYNEFAGGGSFYQRHRARWNNYLLRHGVPEQQAAKLSTFFAAQDALESGHGTSDAAKGKNNFGGMQRLDKKSNKMVNISYPSVDAYMDAKWKMMQNRFGRALNANSIQEYSNLLNDPRYHGKGYMYALYEGYRDGKPLDVAKQTQHMNNYTKILMDIAGEKGFKGAPVPAGQAGEAPASIARPENPYTQYTPAEPFFNQNMTFVRPEDVRKAQEENALKMAESQNAAMQQERKQSVDSFNTLMGLLHTPNNGSSGILDTIATLASLNKNNRFDTGGVKQQPRQYIYDVLPSLFAKDGVKITVSSGFRPGAKTVEGKPSRHSLKQAADIVGDFKAIRRVLDDPNSYTSRWLLANGYGYLDETSATGTTKFWHDHKRDHSHYHIGMDSGIVSKYANMMNGRAQNPLPAQQNIVEQPVELAQATPDIPFTPSNPQAFFGVHPAQQQSVYDYVTTPTVEQPVYDPMAEEKNNALSNLSKFNAIMQLTSPSNNGNNNFLNTVSLLANMSAEGGKIHIKPENRGKFTALKKRTGHSATWFKEHGTPAQRKMATFALNARHWKHGYGGNLYDGFTEDNQQMNIPYAGELPDVTIMPRRIANKTWDKVQERWIGDMPTYYAVNPETGKEEMLREISNGKYSTYDDRHVFDVLGAEAAKKEREQWVKNGGNASDFDKVMLGTLGLGLAPIALPEAATGIWAASQTPAGQTLLAGTLGGEAWEALNHGITGQFWGDNLGDVIGLDKDNYWGRTALGLTNPFYGLSPNMVYKGGAAATELGKSMWNTGKEGAYNIADRYMFMPHQDSFTRGIGMTDAGLQDAVATGVFRGNPRGTEQTARTFDKMFLKNRNHFRDIVEDTGIPGIESRYQSRTLTKEDFNALKKASEKYRSLESRDSAGKITLKQSIDPLENYATYEDYRKAVTSDIAKTEQMPSRIASGEIAPNTELSEPMWFEDESGKMLLPQGKPFLERFGPNSDYLADGTPLSYWYADGRNPITQGHAYAKSNYGVRVNNPEDYQPFMHELHLHPSFFRSPKFADPNVEIFGKGPLGLTVKLDKETLQPMWKRDLFNIFRRGETIRTPKITAENAADDVLAAASDSPFKYEIGTNDKVEQYLTRRRYSDKIHGKPTKSFLDFDPVTGDFVQNNEKFAPDVVKGLPTYTQEDLMHNTVGRNMDAFINEGVTAEEAQAYVDRAKKAMEDVHVGRYSNYDYEKAGYDKTGGFYDDKNNFISVNEGSGFPKGFVEKHEGRHLIDYQADDAVLMPEITGSDYDADKVASLMQRTKQKQNMVLGDAYDNDFLTIPESKFADGLESYSHMSREAVTTNRDARDVLFAKHNFGKQDRFLQNKYIDKMSDDDIFDAVSKANGYGRRYIERLKAEGKLTPKKAKQFREAMKYVGVVATPVSVGLTATGISSKTSDKK